MNARRTNAEAFDIYARTFDETVGNSPVVQDLRRRVYDEVRRLVPEAGRILDINCGTGTDCIALQKMGYRTEGVDLSSEMIDRARRKVSAGSAIKFQVVPFERLGELELDAFDLVLSNNSGLNCADDLRAVISDVHGRLRSGGYLIAVLMPPFSLWETFAGLARFDLRHAFRRGRRGAANIGGTSVEVKSYGGSDLRQAVSGLFRLERTIGFNIISPSPNSVGFIARHQRLSGLLAAADRRIARLPVIRQWGDQICVVYRKV